MIVAREADMSALAETPGLAYIEDGTVGFDSDDDTSYFDGSPPYHVNVTLFSGKPSHVKLKEGVGQGMQIICSVALTPFRIPPRGARVIVAIPHGDIETPGRACVIAVIDANPTVQLDPNRVVMYFGDNVHILLKGASVTLQDTPAVAGPSCFVGVGKPFVGGARGVYGFDETGSGFLTQSGVVALQRSVGGSIEALFQMKDGEIDLLELKSAQSALKLDSSGGAWMIGTNFYAYTAGTYLGARATSANTALWGVSGPAGVPSTSVFIAPI